jgi:hypothetical protein
MEELHSEAQSPFVADPDPDVSEIKEDHVPQQEADSDEEDEVFVGCPVDGCLEQITLAELEDHIEFHAMEGYDEHTISAATAAVVAASSADSREYQSPYSRREDVHRSSREHERQRDRSPKTHGSVVKAWKKLLDGQQARSANNPQTESANGHRSRKRLGVRPFSHRETPPGTSLRTWGAVLIDMECNRELSWANMLTSIKCQSGWSNC